MPHIHEKIDFTVEVFIVHNNKVLLRMHDKYKTWLSVGGHIELDEDPTQAIVREAMEEVGLHIKLVPPKDFIAVEAEEYKELIPPRFLNRHRINPTHEHVCMSYFATANTDVITEGENEHSGGCKWFTKEELDDVAYNIRYALVLNAKAALEELES